VPVLFAKPATNFRIFSRLFSLGSSISHLG
jgi:hypothetical protein